MRQNIFSVLVLALLFMLSGCGSNSKPDAVNSVPAKPAAAEMQKTKIEQDASGKNFTLSLPITKKLDSSYLVELKGYDLHVDGCTMSATPNYSPAVLTLNGGEDSVKILNIKGTFDQNCTIKGYTFSASQTVKKDGKTDTKTFSSTFDYSNPDEGGNTQYILTNATSPLVVNYDNELKTISVDVIDKNGVGIKDKEVSITAVSGVEYGAIMSDSIIKTDVSGHAIFTYKAPADVSAVNGQSTDVTLAMVDNGVRITKKVTIMFQNVDLNVSVPIVVITNNSKNITLDTSSQTVQMEVQVLEKGTNTPYTKGNVKVSLPDSVLNGTDVGHFTEYTVPVSNNGIATFNYTGPQDLKGLVDSGEKGTSFAFHHEDNPTYKQSIHVTYDVTNNYQPANYILSTSSSDGNQTMGLQAMKSFTLYLKDDQGNLVDNAKINQIKIESKNTLIGELVDVTNNGANVPVLTLSGTDAVNSKSFPVQTYTLSGLLPIEITVDFEDSNGDPQILTINMNVVVFSGPPTAMSISYAGVEQNSTTAKYIEKFAVTVTDAYNNPVNTKPYIATGAMVEYAVDGSSGTDTRSTTSPRLWHGANDAHGELKGIGGNKAQFETAADVFKYVDFSNDKLVVFGSGYVYEALGKWDIRDSGSENILELKDDYNGSDRSGLFFAVGHNNRQDLCKTDGTEYVGTMKASNYQLDNDGHALIEFEYDYHLTGKDIMVWVNLTGYQADNNTTGRIGEAKKHTLRGNGLFSKESYNVTAGSKGVALHFNIQHENAPEWYRNGHFAFAYKGCKVENIINSSNLHDARVCDNSARAYVDLNVSNPFGSDCTISLVDIAVSSEFNGVTYP